MPRVAGVSMPKYRKHKASGQAIVTLSGVDHYLGQHGSAASRKSTTSSFASGIRPVSATPR